ncbi:MAG: polysaccharide biosynthesis/export family protein [Planctomycetota bacterium]
MTAHPTTRAALRTAVLAAACVGCQSVNYRAASLPDAMRAAPIENTGQIHLPNLATAGGPSTALSPGDLLNVRVLSGLETTAPEPTVIQISARGEIDLPLIGPVAVAGMQLPDASRRIAKAAVERGVYRQPNITLEVREKATHQVTVLGAVAEPGVHQLPVAACDVVSAIAAAGGLTEEAGADVEVLRQPAPTLFASQEDNQGAATGGVQQVSYNAAGGQAGQPVMQRINLAQVTTGPKAANGLGDRDVVMVLPRKKRVVYVTGLVAKPDQFELPVDQDVRVLDALAMAGGASSGVADKVLVIRQQGDGQEPAVIELSIAEAKANGKENLLLTNRQ